MRWRHALALLAIPAWAAAQSPTTAPYNLASNSQWEIWTGVGSGTAENVEGTGTVAPITASGNSTGTAGATVFQVTTTDQLRVGDLIEASGLGVDPALTISAMRVTALVPDRSITVRVPHGRTPRVSARATLRPIVIGNLAAIGTGDAADGWKKSVSMPIWREDHAANLLPGARYAIGMTKDFTGTEAFYLLPDASVLAGKTITFGISGYHKVRHGAGSWRLFVADAMGGVRTCAPVPASDHYQWAECAFAIPVSARDLQVGVQLTGARGDTYYFANPVLSVGTVIGGPQFYTRPRETLIPVVHLSPRAWINAAISFPQTPAGGEVHSFVFDPFAETSGAIAPSVGHARGQVEGLDAGDVRTGTGYVRLMAFFDRLTAPEHSGSFLAQYVSNVKSFASLDLPLNQYTIDPALRGTAVVNSGVAGDNWSNVSLEFDEFLLD